MLISNSHRFIFVHIPKCAGSAVKHALTDFAVNASWTYHATASEIRSILANRAVPPLDESWPTWTEYKTFTFVRNPFEWLVSLYFWLTEQPEHDMSQFAQGIGFDGFLEFLQQPSLHTFRHGSQAAYRRLQKDYIVDERGVPLVSFVGRYERIDQDWRSLCHWLGIKGDLVRTNESRHPPYRECYTDRTRKLAETMYEADLKYFGYRF